MSERDEHNLRLAISQAAAARAAGDPPYGAVLVAGDGSVLAEDRNTTLSDNDLTAHPELKLARWAGANLDREVARTVTMFASCQPCPMCTNAIARAAIGRVVYALSNEQLQSLKPPNFINPDAAAVLYEGPALLAEARTPLEGYYQ